MGRMNSKKDDKNKGKKKFARNKRFCKFTAEGITQVDYNDLGLLKEYVLESGRIIPSRVTGTKARYQRMVAHEIKIARFLALLPYCDQHKA